jgi:hypothetical protein
MSTLFLRGCKYEINLSSEGTGVYNMKEYLMGSPEIDDESQITICHDTITLNVVGKSRQEVARHVSRLYRGLEQAVDYYIGRYAPKCYLEALVAGDDHPVWASIKAFEFHQLNDPYDYVNGDVIADASLVITREPWRAAPPQDNPFDIKDSKNGDISSRFVLPMRLAYPRRPDAGQPLTDHTDYFPSITGETHFVYLNNSYRYGNIDYIYGGTSAFSNVQPTNFPSPTYFYGFGHNHETTKLRMLIGSAQRFHGIVFPTIINPPPPWTTSFVMKYWTRSLDPPSSDYEVTIPPEDRANYMNVWGDDYSYIGFLTRGDAWETTSPGTLPQAYWVEIVMNTDYEGGLVPSGMTKQGTLVHTPFQPFVDVAIPNTGDLPMSMYFRMTGVTPWRYLDESTESYSDSPLHMNSVIIASAPMHNADRRAVDPGVGFYSLAQNSPYATDYDDASGYQPIAAFPGGPWPFITTIATNYQRNKRYIFREISIPSRPGLYRAFVRYYVTDNSEYYTNDISRGRVNLFMSTSASVIPGVHDHYTTQRVYSVNMGDPLDRGMWNSVCLADFGVIQIGNKAFRSSIGETYYGGVSSNTDNDSSTNIRLEFELISPRIINLTVMDIILLPMNEHYMSISLDRGPLGRCESYLDPHREHVGSEAIWDMASEFLYISGLYPGEAIATIATEYREGETIPGIPNAGYIYHRSIGEGAGLVNSNWPLIPIGSDRRYWFLWYKDSGRGTIWSNPSYQTALKMYGVPRYVTLPAKR